MLNHFSKISVTVASVRYCISVTFSVNFSFFLCILQIKPLSVKKLPGFPRGLSQYVDRGTLETCLHLIALSLSVVSAICLLILLVLYHLSSLCTLYLFK